MTLAVPAVERRRTGVKRLPYSHKRPENVGAFRALRSKSGEYRAGT